MNSFSFVLVLGAIAAANAGLISNPYLGVSSYAHSGLLHGAYGGAHLGLAPLGRVVLPAGHGLEGQYVHDHLETLYDDGSYKPQASPLPLSASPYGLVPSGSGLEGQYVQDNLETLYDNGSYKPELTPVPLSASPYGLVAAGSGLEGAYVHDHSEKFFDDGSYKSGHVVSW